jgi:hypothetical protein
MRNRFIEYRNCEGIRRINRKRAEKAGNSKNIRRGGNDE